MRYVQTSARPDPHSHKIMTFILCSEGDQMLQVFRCQATVEHRAQRFGGGGVYYITANGTKSNLSLPFWERKHSVSQSVINFLNSVSYELGRFVCEPRLRDTAINL